MGCSCASSASVREPENKETKKLKPDVETNIKTEPITVILEDNDHDSTSFTVHKNFKGQIYAYATDNIDNTLGEDGYVTPEASVLESYPKHIETSKITFDVRNTDYTQNKPFDFEKVFTT